MKVMSGAPEAVALARAAREAQLASQVRHPNVVAIIDVDVASDGFFFLVMELVEGRSLREERDRYGQGPWAIGILRQIAEGLAAIHAAGIVHRDLKPANVLLSAGENGAPVVKIADFGVSGLTPHPAEPGREEPAPGGAPDRRDSDYPTLTDRMPAPRLENAITETGELLGTPHYMAPEVVPAGVKAARAPADVFAFGVIAFELLAGRRPFADLPTFVGLSMRDPLPGFQAICASLSPDTARLLDECLSLDPDRRPGARALADALTREQRVDAE
jgi:serine/threonine-protein kinase